jgi:hypothetical protein
MSDWISETLASAEAMAKAREKFDDMIDVLEASGYSPAQVVLINTAAMNAQLEVINRWLGWVKEYEDKHAEDGFFSGEGNTK